MDKQKREIVENTFFKKTRVIRSGEKDIVIVSLGDMYSDTEKKGMCL